MAPVSRSTGGGSSRAAGRVVRPSSTAEVAEVVRLCAEAAPPCAAGRQYRWPRRGAGRLRQQVVLSLARMTAIRGVDPVGLT